MIKESKGIMKPQSHVEGLASGLREAGVLVPL